MESSLYNLFTQLIDEKRTLALAELKLKNNILVREQSKDSFYKQICEFTISKNKIEIEELIFKIDNLEKKIKEFQDKRGSIIIPSEE